MAQNKEKLFTPEDFDKNNSSGEGLGWEKLKKPLKVLGFVAALGGVSYGTYSLFSHDTKPANPDDEITIVKSDDGQDSGKVVIEEGIIEDNQNVHNQEGVKPADAVTAENPSNEALGSETPAAPSTSQPIQDKPITNPTQTKGVIGPSSAAGAVEEEAKEVIRGKYGNGDVRKRNLGDRYAEIQSKVNEMYRNGQVQ